MCWHVFDGAYLRACSNYALTETVAANENEYVTDTSKHFEKQPLCCWSAEIKDVRSNLRF